MATLKAPANAAGIQDKLRAGGRSFLDRRRSFGGGVTRRADAFGPDMPDDFDAWARYIVEKGVGAPTLSINGSRAEFRRPELFTSLLRGLRISGRARRVDTRKRKSTPSSFRSSSIIGSYHTYRGYHALLRRAALGVHIQVRQIERADTSPPVRHMRGYASAKDSTRNGARWVAGGRRLARKGGMGRPIARRATPCGYARRRPRLS